MRNLKSRLVVIENQRQDLIPPVPVRVFLDPAQQAEYLKANPGADTVFLRAVCFKRCTGQCSHVNQERVIYRVNEESKEVEQCPYQEMI
ncbi:MAG: hypothetical protein NTY00_08015 [Deltaproteobacteria bacterium]|nr:hypothetical protein [Deltaproteobacteria bacterium]